MKEIKKEIIKQEIKQAKVEPWQGPIIPAAKVSPEVIQILRTTKVPQLIIPSHTTIPGAAEIYFTEYLKLFSQNRRLNADLIETFQQRNALAQKYNQLKREQNDCDQTIRRKRRFANQIRRDFPCPSPNCHKSYGSEGSLTQHVKLKHQEFYKSGEYQILLQKMLDDMTQQTKSKKQEHFQNKIKTKNEKHEKKEENQVPKIKSKEKPKEKQNQKGMEMEKDAEMDQRIQNGIETAKEIEKEEKETVKETVKEKVKQKKNKKQN